MIVPYVGEAERKQPDIWKRAVDLFNKAGGNAEGGHPVRVPSARFRVRALARALGGKLPYDYLLENTDPELVKMELDICWTVAAEQDPVVYFKTVPGPFPARARQGLVEGWRTGKAYAGALGADNEVQRRDDERRAGLDRLEADLRRVRQGRHQALHRRARQSEVAARRSCVPAILSEEVEFLRQCPATAGHWAQRSADDQLALHLFAAVVLREVAVEGEASGLVGAELEDNRLPGAGAFGDAVRDVNREAVGDVLGGELDLDEVVLLDLDAGWARRRTGRR